VAARRSDITYFDKRAATQGRPYKKS